MSSEADSVPSDAASGCGGSAESRRELAERACVAWQPDLKLFLLGILKDRHAVEDAYQRTFVRSLASAETLRPETMRGWLFRIALNEARQMLREQRRNAALVLEAGPVAQSRGRTSGDVAGESLVSRELVEQVRAALGRLPASYQDVVRRRVYENRTFAEIAAELNLPLGTVLTWMRRAVLKLQQDPAVRALRDGAIDEH